MYGWKAVTGAVTGFALADLSTHFNNNGASSSPGRGGFNIWSNTLPADELPGGQVIDVGGIPFRFPRLDDEAADNVRCERQLVVLPRGRYDWLHVLGAAERRTEDWVHLYYADGAIDPEWLRISDFWPDARAAFGEQLAVRAGWLGYPKHTQGNMRPVLWSQRVPVPRKAVLRAVRLPDNPAIHIFCLTAQRAPGRGGGDA